MNTETKLQLLEQRLSIEIMLIKDRISEYEEYLEDEFNRDERQYILSKINHLEETLQILRRIRD